MAQMCLQLFHIRSGHRTSFWAVCLSTVEYTFVHGFPICAFQLPLCGPSASAIALELFILSIYSVVIGNGPLYIRLGISLLSLPVTMVALLGTCLARWCQLTITTERLPGTNDACFLVV
ncbi:hypothetical protein BDY21DRAFT_191920 [Lineolata rhizophorae]|uniref:Uncharacterized protein n=1 Tax=Lineolata rhizophorae TaxID=578093 RepID=A0A6A6P6L4_9PEZI|nr:hypothetical protein BDY21DRAFT_191920 [Lineolata rhizophorae]